MYSSEPKHKHILLGFILNCIILLSRILYDRQAFLQITLMKPIHDFVFNGMFLWCEFTFKLFDCLTYVQVR